MFFQDLDAINKLMRTEVERKSSVGKRLLSDDTQIVDSEPMAKRMLVMAPNVPQKLGLIVAERATGSSE